MATVDLRLIVCGTEVDEITPLRAPYLGIHGIPRTDQIQAICRRSGINLQWIANAADPHFGIELDELDKFTQAIKPIAVIKDQPPEFLRKHIFKQYQRDLISSDVLAGRIGAFLWDALKPFQRVGVQYAISHKRWYIADEMGSGKTIQASAVLKYYESLGPALLVCPSSLRFTLKSELCSWLKWTDDDVLVIKGSADFTKKKNEAKLQSHKLLIVSYGLLNHPYLSRKNYQIMICDEAHALKNRDSQRFKASRPLALAAEVLLLLSGTPFSYPAELFAPLTLLAPGLFSKFFHYKPELLNAEPDFYYASRYCQPRQLGARGQWIFRGFENRDELQTLLWTVMLRRRKKDILPQLPPKVRSCIELEPLMEKQQKEIRTLLEKEEAAQSDYMESFRLTCGYKIPKVLHFLKECVVGDLMANDPSLKILVFFHHSVMRDALVEFFTQHHISFFVIDGSVSSETRAHHQKAFQETSKYRVGLLSIQAAAAGLNLTAARMVIFVEILFGPETMLQAEDRVHRIGQLSTVDILYTLQPGTTDVINWQLIKKKERESSTILDGRANFLAMESTKLAKDRLSDVLKRKRDQLDVVDMPQKLVPARKKAHVAHPVGIECKRPGDNPIVHPAVGLCLGNPGASDQSSIER